MKIETWNFFWRKICIKSHFQILGNISRLPLPLVILVSQKLLNLDIFEINLQLTKKLNRNLWKNQSYHLSASMIITGKECRKRMILVIHHMMSQLLSWHLLVQSQHWKHQNRLGVFIVNFRQILHIALASPLSTLNK